MDYVYYSALDLAKYIVTKCVNDGTPITNYRLQMMLYLIQLSVIKGTGHLAFCDDMEAWNWGPVIPEVYYAMCGSGALPILDTFKVENEPLGREKTIIDSVIEGKQSLASYELTEEVKKEGSPWEMTYANGKGNKEIISLSMIFDYVKPKAKNSLLGVL